MLHTASHAYAIAPVDGTPANDVAGSRSLLDIVALVLLYRPLSGLQLLSLDRP